MGAQQPGRTDEHGPQACITPLTSLLNSSPVSSCTGDASMSARRSTAGPGRPPRSTAVTDVSAVPVVISSPSPSSSSRTVAWVRGSCSPTSGRRCNRWATLDRGLHRPKAANYRNRRNPCDNSSNLPNRDCRRKLTQPQSVIKWIGRPRRDRRIEGSTVSAISLPSSSLSFRPSSPRLTVDPGTECLLSRSWTTATPAARVHTDFATRSPTPARGSSGTTPSASPSAPSTPSSSPVQHSTGRRCGRGSPCTAGGVHKLTARLKAGDGTRVKLGASLGSRVSTKLMLFCVYMASRGRVGQHDRFVEVADGTGLLAEMRSPFQRISSTDSRSLTLRFSRELLPLRTVGMTDACVPSVDGGTKCRSAIRTRCSADRDHPWCVPARAAVARGTEYVVRPAVRPARGVEHRGCRRVPRSRDVRTGVPAAERDDAERLAARAPPLLIHPVAVKQGTLHAEQESPYPLRSTGWAESPSKDDMRPELGQPT